MLELLDQVGIIGLDVQMMQWELELLDQFKVPLVGVGIVRPSGEGLCCKKLELLDRFMMLVVEVGIVRLIHYIQSSIIVICWRLQLI